MSQVFCQHFQVLNVLKVILVYLDVIESAAKLMAVAQEALDVAMEHGADLEEASTWLALNLAKTRA